MSTIDLASIVPVPRRPTHTYRDPLEVVWVATAERLGLSVTRTDAAYADYDGHGVIAIGVPAILDADDCLAQMIFHEICHWLVEGEHSVALENWGLSNESLVHLDRENASLRVQAALADRHGLRDFLANTTDHRAYYDALPADPLTQDDDGTVALARAALARAEQAPWAPALDQALTATAAIVHVARPFAPASSLYPSLGVARASTSTLPAGSAK